MQQIRILYVDHSPTLGGSQLSLLELVQTLDRDLFTTAVACRNGATAFVERVKGLEVPVYPVSLPRLRGGPRGALGLPGSVIRLASVIRSFRPHLVHTNTVRAHIIGTLAARLTRTDVVWSVRDFTFPGRLARLLASRAAEILCVSESVRKHLSVRGVRGKLSVVPNGIAVGQIDRDLERRRVRDEMKLASGAPLVGMVGRLIPSKGCETFIKMAEKVAGRRPDARFMVVGRPDPGLESYGREMERLRAAAGLDDKLAFPGFREDVLSCICACDLLVHCPSEPEPFGRVIVEAMAVGTPVVALAEGGPCEIIQDGISGILVHPGDPDGLPDAVTSVISDTVLSARISDGGRRRFLDSYTQDVETARIQQVYLSHARR